MTGAPDFDPLGLLKALNQHGVRYVVIGGFAAVAHGSPLPTVDVDVTPARDTGNLTRLSACLRALDARIRVDGIDEGLPFSHDAETLRGVTVLNLVTRLGALDLVVQPAGDLNYETLAAHQVEVHLHDVIVPLASLDDIITSKEAADRAKDRYALPVLRALRDRLKAN